MNLARNLSALLLATIPFTAVRAEDWPQWRGPAGTGVSADKELPIVWNETRGIVWKTKLPEWGASTPAIWGDAIFLTAHTAENELVAMRIDRISGKIAWTTNIGSGEAVREAPKREKQKFHQIHNLASPSPTTDGKTIVVHFGNGDLAALDFEGKLLWKRNLQEDHGAYTIWWGHANSPVIYGDSAISVCMQDSLSDLRDKPVESYLTAHRLSDGKVKWTIPRSTQAKSEECDSYTTPLLADLHGRRELIIMGGNQLDAYDPADGKQLWFLPGLNGGRTITGPVVAGEAVIATQGMRGDVNCVHPTASGKQASGSITWQVEEGTPDSCSPVVWGGLVFLIADNGVAKCVDLTNGKIHWTERLKGQYKASPIAADGRIFFLNTDGLSTVVSAAPKFDKLAENKLDDVTIASPAAANGKLYIRGKTHLYCLTRGVE